MAVGCVARPVKGTPLDNPRDCSAQFLSKSAEEVRDYVDILKPFTGAVIDRNPEDYAAYLKEHGVDIPEKDAFRFAQEAAGEKMKQARKAADKEAAKQLKLKSLSSILSIWSTRSIKCLSVSNKILTKKTALFRP